MARGAVDVGLIGVVCGPASGSRGVSAEEGSEERKIANVQHRGSAASVLARADNMVCLISYVVCSIILPCNF